MKDPGNPTDEELQIYSKNLYNSYKRLHGDKIGKKMNIYYVKGTDYTKAV